LELVVRHRFSAATDGLEGVVDRVHVLNSAEILEPLWMNHGDAAIDESLHRFDATLASWRSEPFDRIINLSFSPLSSYLTKTLAGPFTHVSGYSRHSDGSLFPVDEVAAYFLAQGGVGAPNRLHLLDIFAACAGVSLDAQDVTAPVPDIQPALRAMLEGMDRQRPVVAVQLYASTDFKSLSKSQWEEVFAGLVAGLNPQFILVGSAEDAQRLPNLPLNATVINCMGQTRMADLFAILSSVDALISPDSLCVHIAGLTRTPVLNVAMAGVNSYETGPWSPGSRIATADNVVEEFANMLSNSSTGSSSDPLSFEQKLVEALYFSSPFPPAESTATQMGFQRLHETMQLAAENAERLMRSPTDRTAMLILGQIDDIFKTIVGLAPQLQPMLHWYQVELSRIAPGSLEMILLKTLELYRRVADVAARAYGTPIAEGDKIANAPVEFRQDSI
jgi:ADP-heptose:LPS heptosyltransferase